MNPRVAHVNAITANAKQNFTPLTPIQKEESKEVQRKGEESQQLQIVTNTR